MDNETPSVAAASRRPGRPRKHASDTERVTAYRQARGLRKVTLDVPQHLANVLRSYAKYLRGIVRDDDERYTRELFLDVQSDFYVSLGKTKWTWVKDDSLGVITGKCATKRGAILTQLSRSRAWKRDGDPAEQIGWEWSWRMYLETSLGRRTPLVHGQTDSYESALRIAILTTHLYIAELGLMRPRSSVRGLGRVGKRILELRDYPRLD